MIRTGPWWIMRGLKEKELDEGSERYVQLRAEWVIIDGCGSGDAMYLMSGITFLCFHISVSEFV